MWSSRENFQQDYTGIAKIKNILVKKILSELRKSKQKDMSSYLKFWENFGGE